MSHSWSGLLTSTTPSDSTDTRPKPDDSVSSSTDMKRTDFLGISSPSKEGSEDDVAVDMLPGVFIPNNRNLFLIFPPELLLCPSARESLLNVDWGEGVTGAIEEGGVVIELATLKRCGLVEADMDMDVERDAEAEADTEAAGDFFIEDRSGCFGAVLRPRRSFFFSATEGVADMDADTEGSLCSLRDCGRRCGVRETCSPIAICAMVGGCAERSGEW